MRTARHEVMHSLRRFNLFTDQEWKLLVERGRKTNPKLESGGYSFLEHYQQYYANQARYLNSPDPEAYVQEAMDGEFVSMLAEDYGHRKTFGRTIDRLLYRIEQFIASLVNAARGMGFNTVDSIFTDVRTGRVAEREPGGATVMDIAEQPSFRREIDKEPAGRRPPDGARQLA